MSESDPDRRKFLKVATCAVGGGVGLVMAAPVIGLVVDPAGKTTVTAPTAPLDLGSADRFRIGAPPVKVDVIAPMVKDGWTSARDVVLGAAYIRRTSPTTVEALSAVCPHLGCAIGFDGQKFLCPCHDSRFDVTGARETGPSERGLDPLPIQMVGGRLNLTWVRYKPGQATREPV